ncbi:S8 family serine peptidase, partial [bacterium]|nr:S8 family serine peptidase [bacterium]
SPLVHALARTGDFVAPDREPDALRRLVARLQDDPLVELAWLEPHTEPATLDFGREPAPRPLREARLAPADTFSADFTALQGYRGPAPDGIGSLAVADLPGADGAGIGVVDVEGGWLWSHEDLPAPLVELGTQIDSDAWRFHGTAVLGVIRGHPNGVGVTGIAPACQVGNSSMGGETTTAEAILAAADVLSPGDVIVIELHGAGPNATGFGQEGFVPMEFWQDNFDAIREATLRGLIVVEAAGNGWENLDDPVYLGLFDPDLRHSGAIMVGATEASTLSPAWWTNNGSRVDLNGWGSQVTTLSYGDLQGAPAFPEEQWYTATFNGTSSATPIVTGAVVALSGLVRADAGVVLDAALAREILGETGTPVISQRHIGARPDLVAAWSAAQGAVAEISGTVVDAGDGLPVPDVLVQVPGLPAVARTAGDGTWRLPRRAGSVALGFSSFGYRDTTVAVDLTAGIPQVVPMDLTPLARVALDGAVTGAGAPLADARVRVLASPLAPTTSGPDGGFTFGPVPVGVVDTLFVDGVPGFGARHLPLSTVGAGAPVLLDVRLDPVQEDFGAGDGGFTAGNGTWTHGTPPAAVTGAFTGTGCWGVGMDGLGYADGAVDTLTSPEYDLSPVVAGPWELSFHWFSATEANYDGVRVEVAGADGVFAPATPVGGYRDRFLPGLGARAGWSGHSDGWRGAVFDIAAYVGGPFRFRLIFGADDGVADSGFFVDGIAFGRNGTPSAAPDPLPTPAAAALHAAPNPFNPTVNLAWSAPRPGRLVVTVYDLRGRRVRVLHDGVVAAASGRLRWDGRDAAGRAAASGVYLVRLRAPGVPPVTERVVLAR